MSKDSKDSKIVVLEEDDKDANLAIDKLENGSFRINYPDSILDAWASLYKNKKNADVMFVVGKKKKKVPGHKFVLAARSSMLRGLLFGTWKESSEDVVTIPVPDNEDSFMTMLEFIYTSECKVTSENVHGTLAMADYYGVRGLKLACEKTIAADLTAENVFDAIDLSQRLALKTLQDACIAHIGSDLDADDLLIPKVLDRSTPFFVSNLIGSSDISIEEDHLYKFVYDYGLAECKRRDIIPTTTNIRKVLADILPLLRLPRCSIEYLTTKIKRDGIIPKADLIEALAYYLDPTLVTVDESDHRYMPRRDLFVIERYGRPTSSGSSWGYGGSRDAIAFRVSKPVIFAGFGLHSGNGTMTADIRIHDQSSGKVIYEKTSYSWTSTTKSTTPHRYMFTKRLKLKRDTNYDVVITQRGPSTCSMQSGRTTVDHPERRITVTFSSSSHSNNGTGTSSGQIPELYFRG